MEVVNIPFETTEIMKDAEAGPLESWLERLKQYKSYFKYAFLSLFLLLSFIFVVKPLIKWLTASTRGEDELLYQLPRTVGEIEGLDGADSKQLTFADQVAQLISDDNDTSVGVMRDWLKEGQDGS